MKKLTFLIALVVTVLSGQNLVAQTINANKVVEPFELPKNYLFVEFAGSARNLVLFNYQRIIPITEGSALTARVGFFGFGNSQSGGSEAQMDASGGIGLLLSTQNEHNLEIEASFDRFLSREEFYRNLDQNRYLLTAGYRLQPAKNGKGFGMRVGLGMLAFTEKEERLFESQPNELRESTGFYPTGYLGLGYAF
jgi:hypothetical protein